MRYFQAALVVMTMLLPSLAEAQSCRELRRACEMKEQLGEVGKGNCRAYREQCQQGPDCSALRQACMFKEELGEQGRGNCRAYREQCTRG
jgi:hypothetical protein